MNERSQLSKVLVVGPSEFGKVGGIATHIRNLNDARILKEDFEISTLDLSPTQKTVVNIISVWANFIKNCRNHDLIYLNVSNKGSLCRKTLAALLSCVRGQTKIISHIHGSGFETIIMGSLFQRVVFKILARCSRKIIVLHESAKSTLKAYTRTDICILKNTSKDFSISMNEKLNLNDRIQKMLDNGNYALFVGELSQRKGIHDLIAVWKYIFDQTGYRVFVVGGTPEHSAFWEYVNAHELSKNGMEFIGKIENDLLPSIVRNSKFMILPSYAEGQPISLIEGMSLKIPFVATKLPGILEIDPNSLFSILFEAGNVSELRAAILDMIWKIDQNLLDYEVIRQTWEKRFAPRVMLTELKGIFHAMLL